MGIGNWNQEWRAPLRAALDWLRDTVSPVFEQKAAPLLKDPWAARDEYIRVILTAPTQNVDAFFATITRSRPLEPKSKLAR